MKEIILDTILDGIKLLPFLWFAFFLIELIEHKYNKKSKQIIKKSGHFGPLIGGILGCFPQCGFSVMATNLYVTRIISLGTLISIYLSTSDEMLPILLAKNSNIKTIISLLGTKLIIGIFWGFLIDFLYKKTKSNTDYHICEEENCHCEKGIIKSSIKHTLNTFLFIFLVSFLLNIVMHFGGETYLKNIFNSNNFLSPFLASLIGLIPNCGASIVLTELYLNEIISFSSIISGLLTGSGVAILVLFKTNKNLKENLKILFLVYSIGVVSGLLLELVNIM